MILDLILTLSIIFIEIIGAMAIALVIQGIFYKVFKINLYKSFWKFSDRLDKKINEIFWERRVKDMFTKKDRQIANQKVMIKNRDKLIKGQEEKIAKLEATIMQVRAMASMNNYNHPEIYLKRIKELVRPLNQN